MFGGPSKGAQYLVKRSAGDDRHASYTQHLERSGNILPVYTLVKLSSIALSQHEIQKGVQIRCDCTLVLVIAAALRVG